MKQDHKYNEPSEDSIEPIDPDPFLLASICLQGAAVILQLIQIAKTTPDIPPNKTINHNKHQMLSHLEKSLEEYSSEITRAERTIRRASNAPDKEFYEIGFRISLGVLNFSSKNVYEYHRSVANVAAKLSALTLWVGQIISQDPNIAAQIGQDMSKTVSDAADRLNTLMAQGGSIEAVLHEARLVRGALESALKPLLDQKEN